MTDELLKVLDMTARQQAEWVCFYTDIHTGESLADLAFRLRDEAGNQQFLDGIVYVYESLFDWSEWKGISHFLCNSKSQPIHWIIAALLAKEME